MMLVDLYHKFMMLLYLAYG